MRMNYKKAEEILDRLASDGSMVKGICPMHGPFLVRKGKDIVCPYTECKEQKEVGNSHEQV